MTKVVLKVGLYITVSVLMLATEAWGVIIAQDSSSTLSSTPLLSTPSSTTTSRTTSTSRSTTSTSKSTTTTSRSTVTPQPTTSTSRSTTTTTRTTTTSRSTISSNPLLSTSTTTLTPTTTTTTLSSAGLSEECESTGNLEPHPGCEWTDWQDSNKPNFDKDGGEVESVEGICSSGKFIKVLQARAPMFPAIPISELGQTVTCNKLVGLQCRNSDQKAGGRPYPMPYCLNYEIRALCCSKETSTKLAPGSVVTTRPAEASQEQSQASLPAESSPETNTRTETRTNTDTSTGSMCWMSVLNCACSKHEKIKGVLTCSSKSIIEPSIQHGGYGDYPCVGGKCCEVATNSDAFKNAMPGTEMAFPCNTCPTGWDPMEKPRALPSNFNANANGSNGNVTGWGQCAGTYIKGKNYIEVEYQAPPAWTNYKDAPEPYKSGCKENADLHCHVALQCINGELKPKPGTGEGAGAMIDCEGNYCYCNNDNSRDLYLYACETSCANSGSPTPSAIWCKKAFKTTTTKKTTTSTKKPSPVTNDYDGWPPVTGSPIPSPVPGPVPVPTVDGNPVPPVTGDTHPVSPDQTPVPGVTPTPGVTTTTPVPGVTPTPGVTTTTPGPIPGVTTTTPIPTTTTPDGTMTETCCVETI